ncbi:MAG: GNAT family N-acetyltransferase [Cellvibrionaceae bacterium]
MIEIVEYKDTLFDDAVEIFTQLSKYYLKENASSREVVEENLRDNILAEKSSVNIALAYYDGVICGLASYAILYPATKETGQLYLKELFVSQDYARNGVGNRLMSFMAKVALESNCSRFDWTANEDSGSAVNFYQKIGAPIIQKKKYYRLSGENLEKMADSHC